MMTTAVAVFLLLGVEPPRGDDARIQGTWAVVHYEVDGNKVSEDELRLVGSALRFDGDRMEERFRSVPPTGLAGRFKLDSTTRPRSIDLSEPRRSAHGPYACQASTRSMATLCGSASVTKSGPDAS